MKCVCLERNVLTGALTYGRADRAYLLSSPSNKRGLLTIGRVFNRFFYFFFFFFFFPNLHFLFFYRNVSRLRFVDRTSNIRITVFDDAPDASVHSPISLCRRFRQIGGMDYPAACRNIRVRSFSSLRVSLNESCSNYSVMGREF